MNGNLFRCGWCGCPTNYEGKPLEAEPMKKAVNIIEKYGDGRTIKTHGYCCGNEYI